MDKRDKRVKGAAVVAAIVIAIILLAVGWYFIRDDSDMVAGDPEPGRAVATGGAGTGTSAVPREPAGGGNTATAPTTGQAASSQDDARAQGGSSVDSTGLRPPAGDASRPQPTDSAAQQPPSGGPAASTQVPATSGASQSGQTAAGSQAGAQGRGAEQTGSSDQLPIGSQAGAQGRGAEQTGSSDQSPIGSQAGAQGRGAEQTGTSDQSPIGSTAQTGGTAVADQSPATGSGSAVTAPADSGSTTILTEDQVATLPPIRPPSFDVVRVNELGDAVIAGRAEPRSIVIIYDGDREIGRVAADSRGEWVFVSDRPLTPGQHEIGLLARSGPQSRLSDQVVVLIAPEPRQDIAGRPSEGDPEREKPLALLVPRAEIGATRVLQSPAATADVGAADLTPPQAGRRSGVTPDGEAGDGGAPVSIDVVDYDEAGQLIVSGRSAPDSDVRLYLDNEYVGTARTGADGSFSVQPADPVEPGVYALRVDEVSPVGSVTARAETPFQRPDVVSAAPPGYSQVIVQPGNSLWRIARRVYGEGIQYSVIYQANTAQIRNPDLIYPGQVFNVPEMPAEVPGGDPS